MTDGPTDTVTTPAPQSHSPSPAARASIDGGPARDPAREPPGDAHHPRAGRRWWAVAAGGLVVAALVLLIGDQIGATRAADRDRATTSVVDRQLARTTTDLHVVRRRLATAREQLGLATTALTADQAQLAGARTALQHAQQDATQQGLELTNLHACLVGVEGALNALSVQDRVKAVAALTGVEPSCQAATAGV